MTTFQKVIKYLAVAFAIFLIVNIVAGILYGISMIGNALGLRSKNVKKDFGLQDISTNVYHSEEAKLKISLNYSNLTIKKGETFRAESNNSDISCSQNENQIVIKESGHNIFKKNDKNDLVVYIPGDLILEDVDITTGAGEINIEQLNAEALYLQTGAGKTRIDNLIVTEKTRIEGGVGSIKISSGKISDLELDMGVGSIKINSILSGKSKIEAGIGEVKINLLDSVSNYNFDISKGIGSIKLNNEELKDDSEYGNGKNKISIDGGIGSIYISSVEEE